MRNFVLFLFLATNAVVVLADSPPPEQLAVLVAAQKLVQENKVESAVQLLHGHLKANPSAHSALRLELAHELLQLKRGGPALLVLEDLLKQDAFDRKAHRMAGRVHYEKGDYKNASRHWALGLDPEKPQREDFLALGSCLLQADLHLAALQAFRQGMLFYATDFEIRRGLIQSLTRLKMYAEARSACEETLRLHPRHPDILNLQASLCMALGETQNAINAYESLLLLSADQHSSRSALMDIYISKGMYRETLLHAQVLQKASQMTQKIRLDMAQAWLQAEEPGRSLEILQAIPGQKQQKSEVVMALRARALVDLKRFEEAALEYEALAKLTSHSRHYYEWGMVELKCDHLERAQSAFERARWLGDMKMPALRALAQIAIRNNSGLQARELAIEALQADPEDEYMKKVFRYYADKRLASPPY